VQLAGALAIARLVQLPGGLFRKRGQQQLHRRHRVAEVPPLADVLHPMMLARREVEGAAMQRVCQGCEFLPLLRATLAPRLGQFVADDDAL
jgi:hypothetical protein